MTKEITKKEFNYKQIATVEERKFLLKSAMEGRKLLKQTAESAWLLGKLLSEVKPVLQHGQFRDWIDAELGVSYGAAKHFANTYEHFKSEIISHLAVAPTVVYMLSAPSVSDETRNEAIEAIQKGELKTVAETKQLIEKSKPPKPPKMTADPVADDSDDSDPYEDVGAEELDGFGRPVKKPVKEVFEEMDEIDESINRAEIVYDNSGDFKNEADLSDDEWLESLPIYRVLQQKQHKGIFIKEDLLAIRKLWPQIEKFQHHAVRAFDQKALRNTPAAAAVRSVQKLPHPKDWQVCAPCKGNGCTKCDNAGYHIDGAGISPMRVEKGEVEL